MCVTCHSHNPYAIWLVKVKCFQPHRHLQHEHIRVVVDTDDMVLEPIRPMPGRFQTIKGTFIMCKSTWSREMCSRSESCSYAHTPYECDIWNFKKRLAQGKHEYCAIATKAPITILIGKSYVIDLDSSNHNYLDVCSYSENQLGYIPLLFMEVAYLWEPNPYTGSWKSIVEEIPRYYLDSQCPSDVCQACFEANPKALWLAWLKCTKTEQHRENTTSVTVVTDLLCKELIKVRPLPTGVTQLRQVTMCTQSGEPACGALCQNAHSNCELLYWQWQVAIRRLFQKVIVITV